MFDTTNSFNFAYVFKTLNSRWYYYVALAVFLIILFSVFAVKKQPERNSLTKTQKLVYTSLLTALCCVLNVVDIKVSDLLQLSFVPLIGFIAGYLFGGKIGFAVCFMGDLLGAIIFPKGPYNPIIGIGTGCWGLIFGLAFSYFRGNQILKSAVSFILGFIVISAGINTFGFCLMYPTRYTLSTVIVTLPFKFIMVLLNFALSVLFIKLLPKILPKDKFKLD